VDAATKFVFGLNLTTPFPTVSVTAPTKNDVLGIVPLAKLGAVTLVAHMIHHVPVPVFVAAVSAGNVVMLANVANPLNGCVHPTAKKCIKKLALLELYVDQFAAIVAADG
jgi:hypothetical protein